MKQRDKAKGDMRLNKNSHLSLSKDNHLSLCLIEMIREKSPIEGWPGLN